MKKVAIIGIGQTKVGEHWGSALRDLGTDALMSAMDDAGVKELDGLYVGNMVSGILSEQEHLGTLIADYAALDGVEAIKVESACSSGAAAFRQAVLAVASGAMNVAGAVGLEKLTEYSGRKTNMALAAAADSNYEAAMGLTFVAINAMIKRRYMHEYKVNNDEFSIFPMIAHENAVHNPNAMFHYKISKKDYLSAKLVADPINLLDSSPIADGAAAAIVVPFEDAGKYRGKLIEVLACEIGTDSVALDNRENPIYLKAVERSSIKAYKTSGLSAKDISLFEVHDAFSIISALSIEASGFAENGMAVRKGEEYYKINGALPISTFGGLKGRGHPVGATGMYQIVEAAIQLRGDAPEKIQVDAPRYAMTQNVGGSGATVVTTILKK
jgi:acetyl-CoA C-acetyltransferase